MTVDEKERIEVRISMGTDEAIAAGLQGPGVPVVESIPVAYFMKVRLVGETFAIVPLNSEEQLVPAEGHAEWAWDVTPTVAGTRDLYLVVTALVKAPDAQGERDLPVIERQIEVQVNPGFLLGSFIRDNREWVFPAVLVPLLAALGRWLWTRRRRARPPAAPDEGTEPGASEGAGETSRDPERTGTVAARRLPPESARPPEKESKT
jgi:hypothetical protein